MNKIEVIRGDYVTFTTKDLKGLLSFGTCLVIYMVQERLGQGSFFILYIPVEFFRFRFEKLTQMYNKAVRNSLKKTVMVINIQISKP